MARRSTKENKNIYQTTRENLDLTREEASELLETVSPERIEKIENERSLPYPDEVLLMSDKYPRQSIKVTPNNKVITMIKPSPAGKGDRLRWMRSV